jgi:acetyl-CoA carboxylase carboxyltransferase component
MSYEAIIEGTGSIFLAGSYLVKAAIGESIDNETLEVQRHQQRARKAQRHRQLLVNGMAMTAKQPDTDNLSR